jgi:CheY-like chemotaxis protein
MTKILLAGRDAIETQSRALLLEFLGHRCTTANTLQEALFNVRNDASLRLVLLDEDLLPANHAEAAREIALSLKSYAPIVLLTKSPNSNFPADAILKTPCSIDEFTHTIAGMLRRKRLPPRRVGTTSQVGHTWQSKIQKQN